MFIIYLQRIFALPAIECKWQFFANMYEFCITTTQLFLLRIRTNFYGTPTRNKKVTYFDSKLALPYLKTRLLMLTSQNKALFFILTMMF